MEIQFQIVVISIIALSFMSPMTTAAPTQGQESQSSLDKEQLHELRLLLAKLQAETEKTITSSEKSPSSSQHQNDEHPENKPPQEQQHHQHQQQQQSQDQKQDHQKQSPKKENNNNNSIRRQKFDSRALSAEDMHKGDGDIVEQLKRLNNGYNPQILARALLKLKKPMATFDENESVDPTGDDMETSANEMSSRTGSGSTKFDKTQLIEKLITDALSSLDKDSEGSTKPLFSDDEGLKIDQSPVPNKENLNLKLERLLEQSRIDDSQEMLEEEEAIARRKALNMVESRLLEDISMANILGVSVTELIKDLENKAYMETRLKRIDALLAMNDRSRDV